MAGQEAWFASMGTLLQQRDGCVHSNHSAVHGEFKVCRQLGRGRVYNVELGLSLELILLIVMAVLFCIR